MWSQKLNYEKITRSVNTNSVKWRWFSAKKLNKLITRPILIHRQKSNKIEIDMTKMKVNDSEMNTRFDNEAWSIPEISVLRKPRGVSIKYVRSKIGNFDPLPLYAFRSVLSTDSIPAYLRFLPAPVDGWDYSAKNRRLAASMQCIISNRKYSLTFPYTCNVYKSPLIVCELV